MKQKTRNSETAKKGNKKQNKTLKTQNNETRKKQQQLETK